MKQRYQIGIDPDNDKSGVGVWDRWDNKFLLIKSIGFWDLTNFLASGYFNGYQCDGWNRLNVKIVIEGGWLNKKSNFHPGQGPKVREKIAKNVGMNQQVGLLLESFCKKNSLECEIRKPIGTKSIDADFFKKLTKWEGSTNQDNRDAAMLVYKT